MCIWNKLLKNSVYLILTFLVRMLLRKRKCFAHNKKILTYIFWSELCEQKQISLFFIVYYDKYGVLLP